MKFNKQKKFLFSIQHVSFIYIKCVLQFLYILFNIYLKWNNVNIYFTYNIWYIKYCIYTVLLNDCIHIYITLKILN